MNISPKSTDRSVISINSPNDSPPQKDNFTIDIKDTENNKTNIRKKDDCKTIVKNMLKTRSRSSVVSTPDSVIELEYKYSPTLDRKSYELGNLGDPNLWTEETVQQIFDFSEICNDSATKCKQSSIKHHRISNILQLTLILIGAITTTTSIGSINENTKSTISVVCGCMVVFFSSIQGYLKYPQKSEIEAISCLELERMSRSVKIELSKAKEFRVDPYKYIIKLENQREKILKKVGIEDD